MPNNKYGLNTGMVNPDWKFKYENLNEKIEKWSNILYSVFIKVSVPGLLLPNFILSYYSYFSTDLGSEAFGLPYPFWYDLNAITVMKH